MSKKDAEGGMTIGKGFGGGNAQHEEDEEVHNLLHPIAFFKQEQGKVRDQANRS